MKEDENSIIATAAQVLKNVNEHNRDNPGSLTDALAHQVLCSQTALQGIMFTQLDKAREKLKVKEDYYKRALGHAPIQLKLEDQPERRDDVPGQTYISEDNQGLLAAIEEASGLRSTVADMIQYSILNKLREGTGRTMALECAKAERGCNKEEASIQWDNLVRDGRIEKAGKHWVCTDSGLSLLEEHESYQTDEETEETEDEEAAHYENVDGPVITNPDWAIPHNEAA